METENNVNKKTYEFGLIVGTKREREYWQNKIKNKKKEIADRYYSIYSFPDRGIERTSEGELIYKLRFNTDKEALRIVSAVLSDLLEGEWEE